MPIILEETSVSEQNIAQHRQRIQNDLENANLKSKNSSCTEDLHFFQELLDYKTTIANRTKASSKASLKTSLKKLKQDLKEFDERCSGSVSETERSKLHAKLKEVETLLGGESENKSAFINHNHKNLKWPQLNSSLPINKNPSNQTSANQNNLAAGAATVVVLSVAALLAPVEIPVLATAALATTLVLTNQKPKKPERS